MTTTAPQKAVHGTHWHYDGSVKPAIKEVAFAEVALHAQVYLYMEIFACEHTYGCLFSHPASRLNIQKYYF